MTIDPGGLIEERSMCDSELTHYSVLKRIDKQKLFVNKGTHKPLFVISLLVESSQASFKPRELPAFSVGH